MELQGFMRLKSCEKLCWQVKLYDSLLLHAKKKYNLHYIIFIERSNTI